MNLGVTVGESEITRAIVIGSWQINPPLIISLIKEIAVVNAVWVLVQEYEDACWRGNR